MALEINFSRTLYQYFENQQYKSMAIKITVTAKKIIYSPKAKNKAKALTNNPL